MKKCPRCLLCNYRFFIFFCSPLPEASGFFLRIEKNILSSAPGGVRPASSQAPGRRFSLEHGAQGYLCIAY